MADQKSVFSDDWRDCLRSHYKDVVQRNDRATEDTLVPVLHDVGFSDEELHALKLEATMRTEDLQGDFVPQLDVKQVAGVDVPAEDIPEEATEPDETPETLDDMVEMVNEVAQAEETEDAPEQIDAAKEELRDDPYIDGDDDTPDPDQPQQMSLF